ncbi:hypothetical protein FHL15_008604 [Xylaria flabelliformis]|uniref:Uncharacterized protein n=1 Tax=Xylaria flabelliformis TaxID=2512241 RepID=A0A553HR49_9PEZI|nr:hypothetical protein FHL15_008604 [Xylaria flabelliformis]
MLADMAKALEAMPGIVRSMRFHVEHYPPADQRFNDEGLCEDNDEFSPLIWVLPANGFLNQAPKHLANKPNCHSTTPARYTPKEDLCPMKNRYTGNQDKMDELYSAIAKAVAKMPKLQPLQVWSKEGYCGRHTAI